MTFSLSAREVLVLNPNENLAIVGNTLAYRMQHHGHLETMIHAAHPAHHLTVRNLAFAGDEIKAQLRVDKFGTADEWLTRIKADVIFAFFGFNESFRGAAGLPPFRQQLEGFLREAREKRYNGSKPPRMVIFSPIANEVRVDSDFAVPEENNANLALYTQAMAEVAGRSEGVLFIDLFSLSLRLFAEARKEGRSLTFNGVHLTEAGDARLAAEIFPLLFGRAPPRDNAALRALVVDKNEMWLSRYRTLDGLNVYGIGALKSFSTGEGASMISNYQVMQEEMLQRDVLTRNRDIRVWRAVASRDDAAVSRELPLPAVTPVPTMKLSGTPDGRPRYLDGTAAMAKMTVPAELEVNLFASEAEFPELAKPVQMAWDSRGRLWVAVWPNYPLRTPTAKDADKLLILEDTDGDGRADRCSTFADDLNGPTGFQFWNGGVLLVQDPDLWYLQDTDGDGRADRRERVLMGFDAADSHQQANSLVIEPGGAIYLRSGIFSRTQVETAAGPVRNSAGGVFRYEPRTGRFETYAAYPFSNPHGHCFDRWGNDLITDATGNATYFGPAISGRLDYPATHSRLSGFWPSRPSRPSPASLILTSRHFAAEFQGNFLNCAVLETQGIHRAAIEDDGSGLKASRLPDFLASSDPNFRPVDLNVGPDGAVYVLDWHSPTINHSAFMHLRDPVARGRDHGRVYRVTQKGRPLLTPPAIEGQPISALLDLLKAPEYHVRIAAKSELDRHDRKTVIAAVKEWTARLNPEDPDHAHHLLEALWVHQWQNVIDRELLERVLRSAHPEARAAGTRVLGYWSDRLPDAAARLLDLAKDAAPRVRLQAVRAASFLRTGGAVDIALQARRRPLDYYLNYIVGETVRQLKPYWRDRLESEVDTLNTDPAQIRFLLETLANDELLKLPPRGEVLGAILTRPGMPLAGRGEALTALARARHARPTDVLLELLGSKRKLDAPGLGQLLVARPRSELQHARDRLAQLSLDPATPAHGHIWAALVMADGTWDAAWTQAEKSTSTLAALLEGVPLVRDLALRALAYPRILPLIEGHSRAGAQPGGAAPILSSAIRALVSTRQEPAAQFRILGELIQRGAEIPAAAQALRALPRSNWSAADPKPLAVSLIDWAKRVPAGERRQHAYLDAVQVIDELIGRLPAADAGPLRGELQTLRTTRVLVRAVPAEMRFDPFRVVIQAGRPFGIIFENADEMPHNLVIVKPGARERVGQAALLLPPEHLDSNGRAFVPESSDVIAATKLVPPGQTEVLTTIAPFIEGEYEFVCTFPGHWTVMWGRLVVTDNPGAAIGVSDSAASKADPGATGHPRHERVRSDSR